MKKIIIPITIVLLLVPFVLIQTIYPFFRFGMFAEVEQQGVEETFITQNQKSNDSGWSEFDPTIMGIDKSVFGLMQRNHYYRQEGKLFLEKLHRSIVKIENKHNSLRAIAKWRLIRQAQKSDTIYFNTETLSVLK